MVLRSAHARVGANVPTGSDGVERLSVRPTESACSRGAAIDGCPRTAVPERAAPRFAAGSTNRRVVATGQTRFGDPGSRGKVL